MSTSNSSDLSSFLFCYDRMIFMEKKRLKDFDSIKNRIISCDFNNIDKDLEELKVASAKICLLEDNKSRIFHDYVQGDTDNEDRYLNFAKEIFSDLLKEKCLQPNNINSYIVVAIAIIITDLDSWENSLFR